MKIIILLCVCSYVIRFYEASQNYVVELPKNVTPLKKKFNVYWNVPTKQCKSKKIPFLDLYNKYGIIQNFNDSFRGDKITILYDPGLFPALLKDDDGRMRFRNGGVPQDGDLKVHIEEFEKVLEESVPDVDFDGVGVIDFESWRPVFRQNFGVLTPYKEVSYELERKRHWFWPEVWIKDEAKQRFEHSAPTYMLETLSTAKRMRPKAVWGYYGFPYCFNVAAHNHRESCADNVPAENDQIKWLWNESTALYPSIYSSKDLPSYKLAWLIRGRIHESKRVNKYDIPILPYFYYKYRDGGFMKQEDLITVLKTLYETNADGFIIWGSSKDVNTIEKCNELLEYVQTVLGPTISNYTKEMYRNEQENLTRFDDNLEATTPDLKTTTEITTFSTATDIFITENNTAADEILQITEQGSDNDTSSLRIESRSSYGQEFYIGSYKSIFKFSRSSIFFNLFNVFLDIDNSDNIYDKKREHLDYVPIKSTYTTTENIEISYTDIEETTVIETTTFGKIEETKTKQMY